MRDEIIKMAREAGLPAFLYPELIAETDWVLIERFFHMAQAAEREACAKVCDAIDDGHGAIAAGCANAIRARGNT